ncbi:MAG: choice-of-anchor J domain-containing protein, partial [Candidatus Cloacimonetes bacterium]|nr:choice-of-anchor J domain-containing protein [Candidatus Cloacimonadota bacterium]
NERHTITLGSRNRQVPDRVPNTATVSGICIDTTINALPYQQLFDTVTAPALPVDWSSLIQPTGTAAVVQTYTSSPYSAPNCVRIYNGSTTGTNVLLVAPPLNTTIPINTTRLRLWVKGVGATYSLSVGVLTDPLDSSTFTQVQSFLTPTTWTEFVIPFNSYAGTGQTIAIKHGFVSTGQSIYVDNAMIEVIPQNDISASTVVGNATPSMGTPTNYTVNIFNEGSQAQSTYLVKLFKEGDVEIGSVDGPAINPGQTLGVQVPWTPDTEGSTYIYGKVVLAGDQNNLNDQTANLNVYVQPAGLSIFTIGDGSQTARIPLDMFYKNSLHQYMIYPADISNTIGQITAIGLNNQFTQDLNLPTKIWIGTTTATDLSADWIPITNHTLVYDDVMTFPMGSNPLIFPLDEPYLYLDGQNLVITFNRPMDTQYYNSTNYFKAQTGTQMRARNVYNDSTTYDPFNPPTASASAQFAQTVLYMIPGGVGHLNGTVLGVGNQALEGVHVQLAPGGYQTTTNAQGQYQIMNILPNDYAVTFSRWGYLDSIQNITIEEDETEILNVTMTQMPTVSVTGTINASDTGAGINGAGIHLVGYDNYTVATNTQGEFTIAGVYTDQSYEYTIVAAGYQNAEGTINVGATNYSMGTIVLNEVAYAPRQVQAEINDTNTATTVSWQPPDPTALDLSQGFEETPFPSNDWTQVITNTGEANTSGVFPTWCNFGSITISGVPTGPHSGNYQAGLWWSYDYQDEWLITPLFNCPPSAYLRFWSHVFYGSENGDHYYIKISTNGGTSWSILWDASAQTGGWNSYASPITLDLSMYEGLQVKLAWHAEDPESNDGLWYVWFIDDVYIGNEVTAVAFEPAEYETRSASGNGFRL